jgi:hypothetical protein
MLDKNTFFIITIWKTPIVSENNAMDTFIFINQISDNFFCQINNIYKPFSFKHLAFYYNILLFCYFIDLIIRKNTSSHHLYRIL